MLDVIVRTLGREAQRIEKRSQQRSLMPWDLEMLVKVAGAVTKVVEQINNPFSGTYQARLRRMSDAQLEEHKRDQLAIEGQVVDQ